ncbi:F-box protein-like protein, partial [Tanacetum coccineum]
MLCSSSLSSWSKKLVEYMDEIMIPKKRLEDFPELMHCIQSLLPIEEAARTSILSKSWLYAWSTNPTLRFSDAIMLFSKQPETRFRKLIDNTLLKDLRNNIQSDRSSEGARIFSKQPQNKFRNNISRTLRRYFKDNIPMESFNLEIYIQDKQGASHTNKWIRDVASRSCVKELYLTIGVKIPSLTLPDEIFSGANLNTISVRASGSIINPLLMSSNPVINCVSLRVLELIESLPFNIDSLGNLKELSLGGVIKDDVFFDMVTSNLPFLETLTLQMGILESSYLDITCYSLKRLTLICQSKKTDVKVFAPNLLFFCFIGNAIPSLVFPAIAPEQIRLRLTLIIPIDHLFLLEMREALDLSSKFDIEILDKSSRLLVPLDFELDYLGRRFPLPAMNETNSGLVLKLKGSQSSFQRDHSKGSMSKVQISKSPLVRKALSSRLRLRHLRKVRVRRKDADISSEIGLHVP